MFSKNKIRSRLLVCLTCAVAVFMAFDACTAGGFFRRFIGCRATPVRSCNVTYDASSSYPVSYAPSNGCETTVTYTEPAYEYSTTGIVYEKPIHELTGCPAPTCHDCTVTACDGMCGDYSDVCGGGGEVINECDGVIDFGYSDCCGNNPQTDQGHFNEGNGDEGDVHDGTAPDSQVVETHGEGEVTDDGNDDDTIVEDDDIVPDANAVDHAENLQPSTIDSRAAEPEFDDGQSEFAPSETVPSDFDTPLATEPEREVTDDLGDDLFRTGESARTETPPADSTDSLDTLFGNESTETPDAAMPDQEDIDDLFDDDGPAPAQPAPSAPEGDTADEDLDEIFGQDSTTDATTTTDDFEGLFDESGASDDESSDDLDDLFNTGSDKKADADDVENGDLDALFGQSSPEDVADEATHTISYIARVMPYRTWWDNTGSYQTIGRLLLIGNGHVRLLKSNGRTCVVTFDRLSDADLGYVKSQVEQYEGSLKVANK